MNPDSITSPRVLARAVASLLLIAASAGVGWPQTNPLRAGNWKLNVGKSTYDPGPPPMSSTRNDEATANRLKTTVEGVDAKGDRVAYSYDVKYDGKDYPIVGVGSPSGADSLAFTHVDDLTAEGILKKNGKVVQVTTTRLSKDGRTMTVMSKGTNASGKPTNNVTIWEKQ
jgi:hypothetical protein